MLSCLYQEWHLGGIILFQIMNTYEKPQLVSLQNGNHQTSWYVGKTWLTIQLLRLSISPKYQMVVSGNFHGSLFPYS